MPRLVTVQDLRSKLGRELDALRATDDTLYVSKRGCVAAVVLDSTRYAELIERLDYLEDSFAARQARDERAAAVPWSDVHCGA